MTSVMSNVAASFAAKSACGLVVYDFSLPDSQRTLFKGMSKQDTPLTSEAKIRSRLKEWHYSFFGDTVDANGPEVNLVYDLLNRKWNRIRGGSDYPPENCEGNRFDSGEAYDVAAIDPQQVMQSWFPVLTFFLMDHRYLYE